MFFEESVGMIIVSLKASRVQTNDMMVATITAKERQESLEYVLKELFYSSNVPSDRWFMTEMPEQLVGPGG